MIHIIWEFEVRADRVDEFLRHYSVNGTWTQLFRKSPAFKETRLLRDRERPSRFLTIDVWDDLESYQNFKRDYRSEYEGLDKTCEALTVTERSIGIYEAE